MHDSPITFDWLALLRLIVLWLVVVFLALRALDLLFPRLRRGGEDGEPAPPRTPAPTRRIIRLRLPQPVGRPAAQPAAGIAPRVDQAYWSTNVRMIVVLLLIWFGASFVPAALAPLLNQVTILTGFPLGYYMGSQGSLIVFLGLITAYAWRAARLDLRFHPRPADPAARGRRAEIWRIGRIYLIFTTGFIMFVLLLGILEQQIGLSPTLIGWALLLFTIGIYAVIGVSSRARSLDEYFVAGRRIPAFFNGMAIGADWMSAASFISMAGTLWLLGYEGLAYIMGWTGGYVLLALLLAPYLRKFGQFTIPDFVAARYDGSRARAVAAIIGVIISFTYVTAQVTGIGIIMSRFLGVRYLPGVLIGLGAVLFCCYLGGMKAITWTQVAQCIILLLAYLAPVTILSLRSTGVPFPQLMYGEALQQITRLETAQGITSSFVTPFNDWTPWNFLGLMLCLMLGTAGMPHILIRFYTVPDVGAARRSVGWAMVFICMLYFTAPAYAAFSRWEILRNVVGKPIHEAPEWAINWSNAGLLTIKDLNGDGILQFDELKIDPDLVVLAGRALVLVAALAAALAATRRLAIIVQLVAWAFSLAAATFFPILVLGIFWKRANSQGAIAGMISGLVVTLGYMVLNAWNPDFNVLGITNVAAGVFGVPVNFLVTYAVSKLTAPPSAETRALVESLRQP